MIPRRRLFLSITGACATLANLFAPVKSKFNFDVRGLAEGTAKLRPAPHTFPVSAAASFPPKATAPLAPAAFCDGHPPRRASMASSFDAQAWARDFVELVKSKPSVATDEATMTAWFAGALMRGYDERARWARHDDVIYIHTRAAS